MEREDDEVELAWKAALDDDTFAKLSEADLGYAAHTPIGGSAAAIALETSQRPEDSQATRATPSTPPQRVKRKNFSKQLQLLCLQRYAQYARDFGRLPDKHETQTILQQSHLQFLKDGGAPEEPRLTPPEFLKLIRNRRREMNVAQKRSKEDQGSSRRVTEARKKLQEEQNKIRELIEVIDRTREQQQRRSKANGQQQHSQQVEIVMEGLSPLPLDPVEQIEAILQIHQETREVQREIGMRLRAISRVISHHEGHGEMEEPSSASV